MRQQDLAIAIGENGKRVTGASQLFESGLLGIGNQRKLNIEFFFILNDMFGFVPDADT